jgi:hypothetical protein
VEKPVIILLFIFGALFLGFGIWTEGDLFFIIGLVCIIGGYLLVRRKLKQYLSKKY